MTYGLLGQDKCSDLRCRLFYCTPFVDFSCVDTGSMGELGWFSLMCNLRYSPNPDVTQVFFFLMTRMQERAIHI